MPLNPSKIGKTSPNHSRYSDNIAKTHLKTHLKGDEKGEAQIFLDRFFTALGYPEDLPSKNPLRDLHEALDKAVGEAYLHLDFYKMRIWDNLLTRPVSFSKPDRSIV